VCVVYEHNIPRSACRLGQDPDQYGSEKLSERFARWSQRSAVISSGALIFTCKS
jgi:hypothetical protein